MSQRAKAKNGNILSFFKPVPNTTESERPKTPQVSDDSSSLGTPSPLPLPPSPSPLPPSSPFTPGAKKAAPLTRDLEIRDSEDEDEFASSSDASLEELSAIIGGTRPGRANTSPARKLFSTPRSKRTAVEFPSSPLTIIPKHKFDFKSLVKDAKKDKATNESSTKHKVSPGTGDEDGTGSSRNVVKDIVQNGNGRSAQRVLRAVQRSEGGPSQLRYCFFKEDFVPPSSKHPPRRVKKPWKLLTQADAKTRREYFHSRIPTAIFAKREKLPDEIFNWLLEEFCVQKSLTYREECASLITCCPEQIERLITPERLKELFSLLGVSADLDDRTSQAPMSQHSMDPYEGRDWGCLKSFLSLLKILAVYLALPSVVYAIHALVRMALDKALYQNIDLLMEYEKSLKALLHAVPQPNWDYFCFATCLMIYDLVKTQSIRANVIACLPRDHIEASELRRRLALVFLFDDPELGRKNPDKVITIRNFTERLERDDFIFGPDTDFAELQANVMFLDTAIDDGCFVPTGNPEDEKRFNKDVDELTQHLRELWKEINDAGMKLSRTELKSTIEWVRQRIMYSVRTRRKAKTSIFDPQHKEDKSVPKQREYMKNFLSRIKEKDEVFVDAKETKEDSKEDSKETSAGPNVQAEVAIR